MFSDLYEELRGPETMSGARSRFIFTLRSRRQMVRQTSECTMDLVSSILGRRTYTGVDLFRLSMGFLEYINFDA